MHVASFRLFLPFLFPHYCTRNSKFRSIDEEILVSYVARERIFDAQALFVRQTFVRQKMYSMPDLLKSFRFSRSCRRACAPNRNPRIFLKAGSVLAISRLPLFRCNRKQAITRCHLHHHPHTVDGMKFPC